MRSGLSLRLLAPASPERWRASATTVCLPHVAADMETLAIFFGMGSDDDDVRPSAAKAYQVQGELSQPKFILVKCALQGSPAGQDYNNALSDILRRSAEDSLADSRCDLAAAALEDGGMPRLLCSVGSGLLLSNVHAILEGDVSIFDTLSDSLQYLLEAQRQWSPVRRHEKQDVVEGVVKNLVGMVEVIDLALHWLLYVLVADVLTSASTATGDSLAGLELTHIFDGCPKDTIELFSESSEFSLRCSKLMTALANAATLLDDSSSKLLTGASAHVRANAKSSAFVLKITQGLIKLMGGQVLHRPHRCVQGLGAVAEGFGFRAGLGVD